MDVRDEQKNYPLWSILSFHASRVEGREQSRDEPKTPEFVRFAPLAGR